MKFFSKGFDLVSVIIPTYNRATVLSRAIESVISQSFRNFEIIIIDDGSDDNTSEVIESFDQTVRHFRIPHSGVSRARNAGIEKAKGEWISFLDSDDYWLPQKLQKQMAYLATHPEYKICHTDEIWIKNGKRINQGKKHIKYAGWFFSPSLSLCLISPSTVIIHRDVFDKVGRFDEDFKVVEDYELWLRITARYPVGYVEEKLIVKTGGHGDQLSISIDGIEKYRISALEKFIVNGNEKPEYLAESIKMYLKKCSIYIKGCKKRGKVDEVEELKSRMRRITSYTLNLSRQT
jgi:glycosyltransferase involved in cell wall biosynthesis